MNDKLDEMQKLNEELRESIREARECLKDFIQMKKEWAEISNNWREEMQNKIGKEVYDGLVGYKDALDKAIKQASDRVFARFDHLSSVLMGEDKRHLESIPEILRKQGRLK